VRQKQVFFLESRVTFGSGALAGIGDDLSSVEVPTRVQTDTVGSVKTS